MPQMKVGKDFYTAAQVKEKLGITQGTLYNYVRNGTLKPVVPPGKRQGVYPRKDVDHLARALQLFTDATRKQPTIFTKVTTREEVFESTKLSDDIFGGHIDVDRQYYTTAEVREKLGITQGEIYTYVRNGTLNPVVPPGKRQGVYLTREVDELAREKLASLMVQSETKSASERATKDDVLARLEEHRGLCYSVNVAGEFVGYALFLPLKPEKMEELLQYESFTVSGEVSEE